MKRASQRHALLIAVSVSVGTIAVAAHSQTARPYVPATQCPPKYVPTTAQRGCIPDQTADFEMGRGKHARLLTLPSPGVSTVTPRAALSTVNTGANPSKVPK